MRVLLLLAALLAGTDDTARPPACLALAGPVLIVISRWGPGVHLFLAHSAPAGGMLANRSATGVLWTIAVFCWVR